MPFDERVKAVVYRLRRSLRQRRLATAVVVVVIAVVSGVVLTLAAGARRTSAAPDAYTASLGGDVAGTIQQTSGPPRTAEVAALPGVASMEAITFLFAALQRFDPGDRTPTLAFAGSRQLTAGLVAGRPADPTNPHEFVAEQTFVAAYHADIGDHFTMLTWTQAQADSGQGFTGPPEGPTIDTELVGIIKSADVLEDNYGAAILSVAALGLGDIGTSATIMTVRLDPGVSRDQLRTELDGLPDGNGLRVDPGRIVSAEVRNAVDAQARGLWIMAAVGMIAALVALGQLLSRHARLTALERRRLTALGTTSGQLTVETLARAAVPAVVGLGLGIVGAVAASGLFPSGFVKVLEPSPGLHLDLSTLAAAAALLLAGLLVWVGVAAARQPARPAALGAGAGH